MRDPALVVLAASLLLAGCAAPADEPAPAAATTTTMSIVGLVQDESFVGVPDAVVELRLLNQSTQTDAAGNFRFDGLQPSVYLVDARADGYEVATLTAQPTSTLNSSLNFILTRPPSLRPATEVTHFKGILQCASEALIISGSCDTLLAAAGQDQPFEDTSTFQVGMAPRWQTIVIDVAFEPGNSPGLDGLRLVARGLGGADQLNEYQQYGRFHGPGPFTARLDVNGTYPDGVGPVPGNLTALEFVVYPQGHAWHDVCDPSGSFGCFAGAGGGIDVEFDLYVSVFYNQAAPDGYTLQTA